MALFIAHLQMSPGIPVAARELNARDIEVEYNW